MTSEALRTEVAMNQIEFDALLRSAPQGATHVAEGHEMFDQAGKMVWAITEEKILDAKGGLVASLLRSPPLCVDIGCPWRSGLLGGRI